jgi:hypothetical protein
MPKWNGGVIGVANNPTISSAKGIWSLSEATKAIRAGLWPPSNAGADPYFENVTMLLSADGTNGAQNNTFLDSSTNNFTITRNGNTTQGTFTPFSKPDGRWANYFDGTGDFLTVPWNTALNIGGDTTWTIEFWGYVGASFGTYCPVSMNQNGTIRWGLEVGASATTVVFSNAATVSFTHPSTLSINTWFHYALVRDGTTVRLYINGVASSTTSTNNLSSVASPTELFVGRNNVAGFAFDWNGYLSNFRIVKGSAVYTSAFTPPTAPLTAISGTSLLTGQNNRFIDNSSNALAITLSGTPSVQTFSPFPTLTAYASGTNGGSGYFDGTGDYLTVAASANQDFGSSGFTVEFWYYPNGTGRQWFYHASTDHWFGIDYNSVLGLWASSNGSSWNLINSDGGGNGISTGTPRLYAWNHIVVGRSGGTWSMWLNGTRVLNLTGITSAIVSRSAQNKIVGAWAGGSTYFVNGYMSGFRVVIGTDVYGVSNSSITVPTTPATAITNTQLLLSGTNGGIIDAAMSNDLETVGNAQISTTQSKFGGASMYFDGGGDYLVSPKTPDLVLGNTWTIECWYRPESRTDTYPTIVSVSPGNQNGTIAIFDRHQSYSNTFSFAVGSGAQVNCSTTVSNGTWYHLALVSNAGSVILYVNGTADNTAASRTTSDNTNRQVYVGCNFDFATYSTEINGYVDDLRITRGYARYTANFTAPTAPFVTFGD